MLPPPTPPNAPPNEPPTPPPPADPPAPGADDGDTWRERTDERIAGLEQGQRDMLDAQRSSTEALSQVSQGLATLNTTLTTRPAHGDPGNQGAGAPQPAPPAVQPVPAPMPGTPEPAQQRKRRWA